MRAPIYLESFDDATRELGRHDAELEGLISLAEPNRLVTPTFVTPWQAYGGGWQASWMRQRNGLVVINALLNSGAAGAFFTQQVMTGLPAPVADPIGNPSLLWHAIATSGVNIYNVRFDLSPSGVLTFVQLPGFPNGTVIDFVPIHLVYQAERP